MLPLGSLLADTASWIGTDRSMRRWVTQLGDLARQIGGHDDGDLRRQPDFARAPTEIRNLAAELLRMNHSLVDGEQRWRRSETTQTAVARELHHRVRNNMQMMDSLLGLQAAATAPGEARRVLEDAQLRIATMAMVNGLLYADAEVGTVDLTALLEPLADLLSRHTGVEGEVAVDTTLAPRSVDLDQAMPLALWIVEATICLFERADPARLPTLFRIGISREDDQLCVIVSADGLLPDVASDSLHRRLAAAIAQQLEAMARIDDIGPTRGRIVLCPPPGGAAGD